MKSRQRVSIEKFIILSDRQHQGTNKFLKTEQIVKIVEIAGESPEKSGRPISHWTAKEIGEEAITRGIVTPISSFLHLSNFSRTLK